MTSLRPVRRAVATTRSASATVGGERLLDEHVGAGFHRGAGEVGVGIGVAGDAHEIGLLREPRLETVEHGIAPQRLGKVD